MRAGLAVVKSPGSSAPAVRLEKTDMQSKMIVKRRKMMRGRRQGRYFIHIPARATLLASKPTRPNTESSTSSISLLLSDVWNKKTLIRD